MELSTNPIEGILQVLKICHQNSLQALQMTQLQKLEVEEIRRENGFLRKEMAYQQTLISDLHDDFAKKLNSELYKLTVSFENEIKHLKLQNQDMQLKLEDLSRPKRPGSKSPQPQSLTQSRSQTPTVPKTSKVPQDFANELNNRLRQASSKNQHKEIKKLLQHGADVNTRTNLNLTPLHFAGMFIKLSISKHCSRNLQNLKLRLRSVDISRFYSHSDFK